MSSFAS